MSGYTSQQTWRRVPAGVWVLGVVSLLMDVSSEVVASLLPLYLTQTMMVSVAAVGLLEGVAVVTASATRIFAGALSDRWRNRKWMAVLGYGLSAASRPLFPIADTLVGITAARMLDRVGKGIRGAPRDALVADMSPADARGASFGVRKALDTVGGFLGPLLAIALVAALNGDVSRVLWIAAIPALAAVAVLAFGVREPESGRGESEERTARKAAPVPGVREMVALTPAMWTAIGITSLLTLARFSEAFLVLRAAESGIPVQWVPLVLVGLHAAYGLTSYPAGAWSDRVGRRRVLVAGASVLICAHLTLAAGATPTYVWIGIGLWGVHMGLTQGVLSSLLTDVTPAHLRGSAFGAASFISGLVMFLGNAASGAIWHWRGAPTLFLTAAAVSCLATAALSLWRPHPSNPAPASSLEKVQPLP
jgi:MFS family permease